MTDKRADLLDMQSSLKSRSEKTGDISLEPPVFVTKQLLSEILDTFILHFDDYPN